MTASPRQSHARKDNDLIINTLRTDKNPTKQSAKPSVHSHPHKVSKDKQIKLNKQKNATNNLITFSESRKICFIIAIGKMNEMSVTLPLSS